MKESNIFIHLISNKAFIEWVRSPNEDSTFFWNKWIEEKPEHIKDFVKAREFVVKLQFKDEKLSEKELNDLLGRIIKTDKSEVFNDNRFKGIFQKKSQSILKYASVIIIALTTAFSIYHFNSSPPIINESVEKIVEWKVVSNPRGKKSKVILPDGTIVDLNYESTLKYPNKFNDSIREVELIGEAFFDVHHADDYPFIVKTGVLETEVFGTSFNVNSFDQNNVLEVSLVTGKVKVKKTDENTKETNYVSLVPGEQLSYDKDSRKMEKNEFDIKNITAWREGSIIFEDVNFKQFIDRLERWYGVNFQIHGNPPANWRFNGRYQNENIENILIGVKFVYNLKYYIQGNNITIKFK